jgi:hypothetical protein
MRYCITIIALICLTGCGGQQTLDGSDPDTLARSYNQIRGTLTEQQSLRFERAFLSIAAYESIAHAGGDTMQAAADRMDGMTYAEVIAEAEQLNRTSPLSGTVEQAYQDATRRAVEDR